MPNFLAYIGSPAIRESLTQKISFAESGLARYVLDGTPNHVFSASDNSCTQDGIIALLAGTPTWNSEVISKQARDAGACKTLVEIYRSQGVDIVHELRGSFAFVVIDSRRSVLLAATDRLGVHPLYYSELPDGGMALSTRASFLADVPGIGRTISNQGVFDYIYFHMIPSPVTIFEGVRKLEPAQQLTWNGGDAKTEYYWIPRFTETREENIDELGKTLLNTLEYSIRETIDGTHERVGAFLSGGLDSSTVSGLLSSIVSPNTADTFSIGFDAEGYDEIGFARIANRRFNTNPHEYYVTPDDVLEACPKIAAAYDEPFGNSSALPTFFCARLAKSEGIQLLLAGDGGDELFAGNERYVKQFVFEHYHRIPQFLRTGLIEPVISRIGVSSRINLLRKASSYIEQANVSLPERLQSYNFLHRIPLNEIFADDFLSNIDSQEPLRMQRSYYHLPTEETSTLNRMLFLDWKYTLADNDLRKVTTMCELAGIDVAYPMLSNSMLDLSLGIPSDFKIRNGKLRYFYKHAVRDLLPTEILNKKKHGFGLPFGVWTQKHDNLRDMAYSQLSDLRNLHIFQTGFIDKVIDLHRSGHAGYYGELVWILMMLQLWREHH